MNPDGLIDSARFVRDTLRLAWTQRDRILDLTAAHLLLVLMAVVLAVLIGVPLGVLSSRSPRAERVVLLLANVFQTIPSLALLGLLLIVFQRIGNAPALAALVIYALLPIIRNTVLGLRGIDRSLIEAAEGLGMTGIQRLTLVELPLAVPVILGGIRLATVASVGMATISSAIGAQGLGIYIFRGMQTLDGRLVLLGSVPTAALALICDGALGEAETLLDPRRRRRSGARSWLAMGTLAALALLAIRGAWPDSSRPDRQGTIVIGSKNFSEANLLGHMLAELIEARTGLAVDRRFNLDGFVCYQGLKIGDIDVYVEYTGTALTALLKQPPLSDPEAVRRRVSEGLRSQGIVALEPLGFENTFAILMRREQAETLGLTRLSQVSSRGGGLQAGFGTEFMSRPDGYPGLVSAYGLKFQRPPLEMDLNLLYQALRTGTIDLTAGNSTDGRIEAYDLVALEDDRRYFPPYEAVPLARAAVLEARPELRTALELLGGTLDAATMRRLNHQIDGERRAPAEVAREWLTSAGLLE